VSFIENSCCTLITLVAFRSTAVAQATNTSPTQRTMGSRKHRVGLPNFGEVTPNLFRGGQPGVDGLEALEKMAVRMLADMRGRRSSHEEIAVSQTWNAICCHSLKLPFSG